MIETDITSLQSALYGILRLVSGYQDWRSIEDNPNKREWIPTLLANTTAALARLNEDPINADPREQSSLMRKLRAYQQLALIEKFCLDEVEW